MTSSTSLILSERACALCSLVRLRTSFGQTPHVVAVEDGFPSAAGHILVVPWRHVGRITELTDDEHTDLWQVARDQLLRLDRAGYSGYTIGVNDGPAAGQTVPHVHLHVIPRTPGDVDDPRGGVRWVLPTTAPYWRLLG